MGINIQRFLTLPNALKPLIFLFVLLSLFLAASAQSSNKTLWFFWLNTILQLVFMAAVVILFLYEAEAFLGCGREGSWPVVEMSYSVIGVFCNLLNVFILAGAHKYEQGTNSFVIAAFTALFLCIFYAIGGLMMFRIWRGFVKSGANQNPTANVRPGNPGAMHPGV